MQGKWLKASESMLVHENALKKDAEYVCINCNHKWIDRRMSDSSCDNCDSIYYKWINFNELKKNNFS